MSVGRMEWVSRGPALVLLFTLASVYTFAGIGLSSQLHGAGIMGMAGVKQGATENTSSDVPDAVVEKLTQSLAGIVHASDELAVLPAPGGTGFTVSTIISLDETDSSGVDWQQTVTDDVSQYFADVYAQTQPIEDAQIFFLKEGQVVAGAGLGRQVYEQLAGAASTGSGGFVASLQAQPVRTNEGAMDSWVEISDQPNS